MQDTYIIKQINGRLICFFHKDGTIFCRIYDKNKWGDMLKVYTGALSKFTVTPMGNDHIHIFCQKLNGDMVHCKNVSTLEEWENKTILQNKSSKILTNLFYPLLGDNNLCLIYNVPSEQGDFNTLSMKTLQQDDNFYDHLTLDKFTPLRSKFFELQNIGYDHGVIFYQSRRSENNIGYMEVKSGKHSEFKPIHLTSYQLVDASFLTTPDSIACLYIVKSVFSHQLLYKNKTTGDIGPATMIWEGGKIDSCSIFMVGQTIFAVFKARSQMFISSSTDNGKSFTKPELYKNKLCQEPKKATFIHDTIVGNSEFIAKEVYVDTHNPWDIQILPELYEDFYYASQIEEEPSIPLDKLSQKDEQINYMSTVIEGYKSQQEEIVQEKINYQKELEKFKSMEEKYAKKLQTLTKKVTKLETDKQKLQDEIDQYKCGDENPVTIVKKKRTTKKAVEETAEDSVITPTDIPVTEPINETIEKSNEPID